jgi:acetyl-CoA C-acetyltransferase
VECNYFILCQIVCISGLHFPLHLLSVFKSTKETKNMDNIVIVGAARTPIGNFLGGLSTIPASELGSIAIKAALERTGIAPENVDDVIMGQVLTAGVGQNPARQAALLAGMPVAKTAMTINQVCGSGLRAVALIAQSLKTGDINLGVAGGQENMSLSPHVLPMRNGQKMGDASLVDTMIKDGLWDVYNNYHMGITAENIAKQYDVSRETQDAFAVLSQNKAAKAQASGAFDAEITPVTVKGKKGDTIIAKDEFIRADTTKESLAALRPAFDKGGTVTAGNASGINDGAAALVLMREKDALQQAKKPLARIVSFATRGIDPKIMGMGPVPASEAALARAGWTIDNLDLIEANEAFAAQACAVGQVLKIPETKLNVHGGAIALGHPIGASGARVLTTLLYALQKRGGGRGLATLCIGGGMGIAVCVEAV